jgi:hypothetical protein
LLPNTTRSTPFMRRSMTPFLPADRNTAPDPHRPTKPSRAIDPAGERRRLGYH